MYKPKSREEYIALCRYYDGKEVCPEGFDSSLWDYERIWVEEHFTDGGLEVIRQRIDYYKSCGLGSFMSDDGTPIAIKALLWNRYEHWTGYDKEDFKKWYKRSYLKMIPLNSEN